jgi:peptidoglycan endopeptidase LytE
MPRYSRVALALTLSVATFGMSEVTAHAAPPGVYVVKEGDSLGRIASKLGVTLPDLLTANDMSVTSLILPGQELVVPSSGQGSGGTGGGTYTVKAGDSLSVIASRHQVKLGALLKANDMTVTSLITPGMVIQLPAGAAAPTQSSSSGGSAGSGSAGGGGGTYTVKAGDSLSVIASRHQVKLGALLKANEMTVTSLIMPGMTLTLPAGAVQPAAPQSTASNGSGGSTGAGTYTVKAGDSLSAIAARHKVKLNALLTANGLQLTSLIMPGMTLTLPSGATTTASQQPSGSPSTSSAIDTVISFALAQQGKPYQFARSGPDAYDCSGLVKRAYSQIGITLVHQSAAQAKQGTPIDFLNGPIRAGDLVFMATRGSDVVNHVGIALDDSTWIQARRPGDVVRVGPMPSRGSIVAVTRLVP